MFDNMIRNHCKSVPSMRAVRWTAVMWREVRWMSVPMSALLASVVWSWQK
jgi:hypothetical protein